MYRNRSYAVLSGSRIMNKTQLELKLEILFYKSPTINTRGGGGQVQVDIPKALALFAPIKIQYLI